MTTQVQQSKEAKTEPSRPVRQTKPSITPPAEPLGPQEQCPSCEIDR